MSFFQRRRTPRWNRTRGIEIDMVNDSSKVFRNRLTANATGPFADTVTFDRRAWAETDPILERLSETLDVAGTEDGAEPRLPDEFCSSARGTANDRRSSHQ